MNFKFDVGQGVQWFGFHGDRFTGVVVKREWSDHWQTNIYYIMYDNIPSTIALVESSVSKRFGDMGKYYIERDSSFFYWGGGEDDRKYRGWVEFIEEATIFSSLEKAEKMAQRLRDSNGAVWVRSLHDEDDFDPIAAYDRAMSIL